MWPLPVEEEESEEPERLERTLSTFRLELEPRPVR
eukprot:SAG11_NODE_6402_length_1321_cov_1.032733_2_plen_34_part_01